MPVVDLRSDTITKPTPAMLKAMVEAPVGDDVFGEDPTVNRLEEMAAEVTGKAAALFVASGTMGNLVSQLSWCGRGDEILLGDQSHIFFYEQGGSAAIGGIHPRTVPNRPDGTIDLSVLEQAIRPNDIHFPRSRVIVLENTHNRCHGSPVDGVYMRAVAKLAEKYGLKVHVDGARIFNAATALGIPVRDLVEGADSVSFCLSKGLAAPAGAMVCGSRSFINTARRARKVLGGGMRQSGVLAAAGIVALTDMVARLSDDHANARRLADGLVDMDGLTVAAELVKTNIVFITVDTHIMTAEELVARLDAEGVKMLPLGPKQLRAVTNYHITPDDIEYTVNLFARILKR